MKKHRNLPATFRADNRIIQNAPFTFGGKRAQSLQLYLPGLAPFGPFDYWATLALYALLDPKKPTESVKTTPTELLEVLQFARVISSALGDHETFETKSFKMVNEALQRLYTVEVNWRNYWLVRMPGEKKRKKQWVEYHGRILSSFAFIYAPGVTPPSMLPAGKRRNINKAKTTTGEAGPPIWDFKETENGKREGPQPVGIEYTVAADLVRGLTRQDPNIGATTLPMKIFSLRKTFGRNPTATRLLLWVCRQTDRTMKRTLAGLARELNLEEDQPARSRDTLLKSFDMLKASQVIEDFGVEGEAPEETVTFTKSKDWHFEARKGQAGPPALPAP